MKKLLLWLLTIWLILLNNVPSASALCLTCSQVPADLTMYRSSMQALLNMIDNSRNKKRWESNNILNNFPQIIERADEEVDEKALSSVYYQDAINLVTPLITTVYTDFTNNFEIIFYPYPIVRDWSYLDGLDKILSKKITQLIKWGQLWRQMDEEDIKEANEIFAQMEFLKIANNTTLWKNFELNNKFTYGDLLRLTWKYHIIYKHSFFEIIKKWWVGLSSNLSMDLNDNARDVIWDDLSLKFGYDVNVMIDPNYISRLHDAYLCVSQDDSGDAKGCEASTLDKLSTSFAQLTELMSSKWYKKSTKRIIDSYNRLKYALYWATPQLFEGDTLTQEQKDQQVEADKKFEESYNKRKDQLMWKYFSENYWSDAYFLYQQGLKEKSDAFGLWRGLITAREDGVLNFLYSMGDAIDNIGNLPKKVWVGGYKTKDEQGNDVRQQGNSQRLWQSITSQKKYQQLSQMTLSVMQDTIRQYSQDIASTLIEDPSSVTMGVVKVSQNINSLRVSLGSVDSEDINSIYKNLSEICSKQCSNVKWICDYSR